MANAASYMCVLLPGFLIAFHAGFGSFWLLAGFMGAMAMGDGSYFNTQRPSVGRPWANSMNANANTAIDPASNPPKKIKKTMGAMGATKHMGAMKTLKKVQRPKRLPIVRLERRQSAE